MFPPRDRAFDRITALAAMLFDAPMAGIVSPTGIEASLGPTMTDALDRVGDAPLACMHEQMQGAPYARFFAGVPLHGSDGERRAVLYVADTRPRHVSARQLDALKDLAAMATAELNQRRMASIVATTPQMVFVQDAQNGRVTWVNHDASDDSAGAFPTLDEIHPDDRAQLGAMRSQLDRFEARAEVQFRVKHGEGWRWLHVKKRVSRCDANGNPLELTGIAADITEAKETERALVAARDQLAQLVTTDELTQIANKRALNARLQQLVAEGKRGRRFAVVMADVDHFKRVNDSFGHAEGDRVLQEVAKALSSTVRETDFVARFGGEEFCVLLTDVDAPTALRLAERLRTAIETLGGPFKLTMSFGVATCAANDRSDAASLLEAADDALYRAKESGRNRVAMARRVMPSARPERKKGARAAA